MRKALALDTPHPECDESVPPRRFALDSHRYKPMMYSLRSQGLLTGVRLLYMREGDVGKLHTVVSLHLLDREREGVKQRVEEKDAGLGGESKADPGRQPEGDYNRL